ncbi:MAG: DUF5663 domain-containing protein [Candidatus Microsaccharimonas sp.]
MYDEQYIIQALDISTLPDEKKHPIVVEATMRVGNTIIDSLNEEQYNEYKAIIDDDHQVIDEWLSRNVSDYKENTVYQEMLSTYDNDSEKNNPAKLFATLAWLQVNISNLQQIIENTLQNYKKEL